MKVLTVEDEVLVSLELAMLIRQIGHEPLMAASGEDALRLTALHHPNLVLMDVRIGGPLSDGIEVAKEIRRRHDCGLLFLTGLEDPETRLRAASTNPDAFLTKPFSPKEIKARMEELLRAS